MSAYTDKKGTFYIGEFDLDMEKNIIIPLTTTIKKLSKKRDATLDMYVNSFGGYAAIAFHIVELMELAKREDITVRTIVTSAAYSAGSIVAVAGTPGERYIAKNARHLVHYGYAPTGEDSTPLQTKRSRSANEQFFKQVENHYKTYCEIPELEENMVDDGWFINASQAKRWGMADKFLDRLVLNV